MRSSAEVFEIWQPNGYLMRNFVWPWKQEWYWSENNPNHTPETIREEITGFLRKYRRDRQSFEVYCENEAAKQAVYDEFWKEGNYGHIEREFITSGGEYSNCTFETYRIVGFNHRHTISLYWPKGKNNDCKT